MSSRGTASTSVGPSAEAVRAALLDLEGWARWMPGVVAATPAGPDAVDWRIQTPVGPALVPLVFTRTDAGVTFGVRPGAPISGPFTNMEGRAEARPAEHGTTIELELLLEGRPRPPRPMARMLVQGALDALTQRLAREDPVTPGPTPSLIAIPMSDGVDLAALHFAAPTTPAPVVLLHVPYRKDGALVREMGRVFTGAGYHFVAADVRGFGGSVAPYEGLLSQREADDYVDLVEWAADQSFSDGNVATFGASYCGANQLLVGARAPRGLRCITVFDAPADTYRDWTHRGGIPTHLLWGAGTYLHSGRSDTTRVGLERYYLELMLGRLDDDGHRARSPEYVLDRIEVPALLCGGWHDYFLRPTVRAYRAARGPKRGVFGSWGHADMNPERLHELLSWLAFWLRGEGADPTTGNRVRLFDTGTLEWLELPDWPEPDGLRWDDIHPAAEPTPLRVETHFWAQPPALNVKPEFDPDPTDSGFSHWGEAHTFDTEPLTADLPAVGPVVLLADLVVDDVADLDLHARVSVVDARGEPTQITEGRLRASHRAVDPDRSVHNSAGAPVVPWHPHDREDALEPGQPVQLAVEINPLCHTFRAGERIRLGLTLMRSDEVSVTGSATLLPTSRLVLGVRA